MSSLFSGMSNTKPSQGGVFLLQGNYTLEVVSCKADKTWKGDSFFVVNFKILESTNPEREAGSNVGWMTMFKFKETALANIKSFLMAAAKIKEDEVDEPFADAACGSEQPLKGCVVHAQANEIITKQGKPFTKVLWYPVEE